MWETIVFSSFLIDYRFVHTNGYRTVFVIYGLCGSQDSLVTNCINFVSSVCRTTIIFLFLLDTFLTFKLSANINSEVIAGWNSVRDYETCGHERCVLKDWLSFSKFVVSSQFNLNFPVLTILFPFGLFFVSLAFSQINKLSFFFNLKENYTMEKELLVLNCKFKTYSPVYLFI